MTKNRTYKTREQWLVAAVTLINKEVFNKTVVEYGNYYYTNQYGKGTEGEQKRNMLEVKTEFYETLISPSPSLNGQAEDFVSMSSLNQKVDELVNQRSRDMEAAVVGYLALSGEGKQGKRKKRK